ncbi:MAG TPA: hypothetical protein VH277_12030 [Gemmatimonadaceae bacterium]|nr:hypothetical protein [Gemmatimonadaceae bacterium]
MMKCSLLVVLVCASAGASACALPKLSPDAPPLNPFADFEWRSTHSPAGRFLRGEALHANDDVPLAQVLHTQIAGFGGQRDARTLLTPGESCSIDVYLNGGWAPGALDELHARDVEAVEYYQATSAPVRYRRAGHVCPVLLLWLRQ